MKVLGNQKIENKIVVIDNWYSEQELKAVWKELDFYSGTQEMQRAENNLTVTGVDKKGEPQAKCYRIFLDSFYQQNKRHVSSILSFMKKFKNPNLHNKFKTIPMGRQFTETNSDTSFISYYENEDNFKPHFDVFQFTALIWLYKEPKKFTGGNLVLHDFDNEEIKVKNNRLVFFPSYYLHSVTPIKIKDEEEGMGRYCISHFFYTVPTGKV